METETKTLTPAAIQPVIAVAKTKTVKAAKTPAPAKTPKQKPTKLYYAVTMQGSMVTLAKTTEIPNTPKPCDKNWKEYVKDTHKVTAGKQPYIFGAFTTARCFLIYDMRIRAGNEKDKIQKAAYQVAAQKYWDMKVAQVK